jgi:nitrilase
MEANHASNISYAVEVGAFNIVSTAPISQQNQDVLVDGDDSLRSVMPLGGGMTFVLDPEGRQISTRPPPEEEAIVFAEVDLAKTFLARAALDTVGHYARNDVFKLLFDPTPRQHIHVGPHGASTVSRTERVSREDLFGGTRAREGDTRAREEDSVVSQAVEGFRAL